MIAPQATETIHWSFHTDLEKIGWLTINTPGASVNTLSRAAIMELETLVARFEGSACSSRDVLALIVAGLRGGGWRGTAADLLAAEIEGGPLMAVRVAAELLARAFVPVGEA